MYVCRKMNNSQARTGGRMRAIEGECLHVKRFQLLEKLVIPATLPIGAARHGLDPGNLAACALYPRQRSRRLASIIAVLVVRGAGGRRLGAVVMQYGQRRGALRIECRRWAPHRRTRSWPSACRRWLLRRFLLRRRQQQPRSPCRHSRGTGSAGGGDAGGPPLVLRDAAYGLHIWVLRRPNYSLRLRPTCLQTHTACGANWFYIDITG